MIVNNKKYSIALNSKGAIESLVSAGKEFVKKELPLFQFRLRNGTVTEVFHSDSADKIEVNTERNAIQFTYIYQNLNIKFIAELSLGERITLRISCENHSEKCVEWIDFPQIAVPNDLVRNGGGGRLVLNTNEGLLVEDLWEKENLSPYAYQEMEYPSAGLYSMFPAVVQSQFLSYYDDYAGIYIAAEDNGRSIKGIDFAPLDDAIKLQFRIYPGVEEKETLFTLPYDMVIDFFKGDWHDAADLYRSWFEQNLPEDLLPIEHNADLPQWYTDSPLVVTYPVQGIHDMDEATPNRLFPYNNSLAYLDDISERTNSRIMALLMHWEGTAPWAPPYVWPPLGGENLLSDFCNELHRRDFLLGVYCSGISYTVKSNINAYTMQKEYEEKGLSKYMCTSVDGTIESRTCQGQRKSYDMCISQAFTKEVLCNEAEKMISCGLDYIQILDQNHGGTPYFCYSNKHGHPAMPGKWMVDHMTDFLKNLKQKVGSNVLLGCESAASEAYIPYLNLSDNRFNLNYMAGRPIPLYGYIYHKYLYNFSGNSVSSLSVTDIYKSPDCHMLRVAHSYLAGDLMTLVINQDGDIVWSWGERDFSYLPDRDAVLEFVKVATAYRRGVGKKYLVYGEMIKPLDVQCDTVPMYKPITDYVTQYPAVLTTAWQASDGTKAQFFASYRKQEEKCTVDLTGTKGAYLMDENGKTIKTLKAEKCEITIPKHSVRMLVLI